MHKVAGDCQTKHLNHEMLITLQNVLSGDKKMKKKIEIWLPTTWLIKAWKLNVYGQIIT